MNAPLVIVGTGAAGYGLLRTLRRIDARRPVCMITADDGAAYSKSQLACSLARGKNAGDLVLATAEQMAYRFEAKIIAHTRVLRVDRGARTLVTDGADYPYGRLVLALGCEPVRPSALRGTAARQVLTVGSLADYRYLRSELAGRKRVVILGGGVRGCEFAENLTRAGCHVTLIEQGSRLFGDSLPWLCAERVGRSLSATGVRVRLEDGVQRIDQGVDDLEITLMSGDRLTADVVVAALGQRPRAELAREARLDVNRGIVVDRQLRTNDPEIFALGECAELGGRALSLTDDIETGARVLAARLFADGKAQMQWQPRLQRLQIECCPAVLCEPPPIGGEWQETGTRHGVKAVFHDRRGALRGFALVGDPVAEAARLLGRLTH